MAESQIPTCFKIVYQPNYIPLSDETSTIALELGQRVVGTLRNHMLSKGGQKRPLEKAPLAADQRLPGITLTCTYPGNAVQPPTHAWRVPAETDGCKWQLEQWLARLCFDGAFNALRGHEGLATPLDGTKKGILSGGRLVGLPDFIQAFADLRLSGSEWQVPVSSLTFVDRTVDAANAVFGLVSGSEVLPEIRCGVEVSDPSAIQP